MPHSGPAGTQSLHQVQKACAYLFSPDHARNPDFIKTLDVPTLRQAFRKKARQYHPDLHPDEGPELLLRRKERFIRIRESYELLSHTLRPEAVPAKKASRPVPSSRPRIIAVGGAKGGIGKSLFAANLAIYLSKLGLKTIALDLDLGGANLHLYMGKTRLSHTVNDFLVKKTPILSGVIQPTAYGASLIGGDSSCLGAGNIGFARKLKLLKAVRHLDADVIVADLGGDTAFNVLDFFLSADIGLVMTTSEPAAYLEAYAFIKVALYRKLARMFGPESFYAGPADPALRRMVQEEIKSMDGSSASSIARLRARVRQENRSGLRILDQVLSGFAPLIVVNKLREKESGRAPVRRIQDVSQKTLAVSVGYLGDLPFDAGLEMSARTLTPFVTLPESAGYKELLKPMAERLMAD